VQTKIFGKQNSGFAVMETLTLLLIVGVIAAAGIYVYKHRNDTDSPVADTTVTAPVGSTSRTDELNQLEIDQETELTSSFDSQRSELATGDNAAMANLEGASDGSEL